MIPCGSAPRRTAAGMLEMLRDRRSTDACATPGGSARGAPCTGPRSPGRARHTLPASRESEQEDLLLSFPEGRRRPPRDGRPGRPARREPRGRRRPGGSERSADDHGAPRDRDRRGRSLIVILLVLGINGCLDSRKDTRVPRPTPPTCARSSTSSAGPQRPLLRELSKPSSADALDVQTQVNAQRVDAEQLVERAKGTDHPAS